MSVLLTNCKQVKWNVISCPWRCDQYDCEYSRQAQPNRTLSMFRCENIVLLTDLSLWQGLLLQQNFRYCVRVSSIPKFSLKNIFCPTFALKSPTTSCVISHHVTTASFLQSSKFVSAKILLQHWKQMIPRIPSATNPWHNYYWYWLLNYEIIRHENLLSNRLSHVRE
jgi:hypothetical protein